MKTPEINAMYPERKLFAIGWVKHKSLRLYSCCGQLMRLRRELNEMVEASSGTMPLAVDGPDREPLKLTLDAAALGMTGNAFAEALRKHSIECEYADPRYVVLMFTPENPARDYDRLEAAVKELCASLPELSEEKEAPDAENFTALEAEAASVCTVRQAVFAPQEEIPASEALGRVCAMPTVSCPPAIPIVVSGERIGPAARNLFERYHVKKVAVLKG